MQTHSSKATDQAVHIYLQQLPQQLPQHLPQQWQQKGVIIAFIAAGLSIATGWLDKWAAAMMGIMFLLWFVVLHAPRVISYPRSHDPDEWSSAFIALGISGGCWILAGSISAKKSQPVAIQPELVSSHAAGPGVR